VVGKPGIHSRPGNIEPFTYPNVGNLAGVDQVANKSYRGTRCADRTQVAHRVLHVEQALLLGYHVGLGFDRHVFRCLVKLFRCRSAVLMKLRALTKSQQCYSSCVAILPCDSALDAASNRLHVPRKKKNSVVFCRRLLRNVYESKALRLLLSEGHCLRA
jgi:hypothetical protein